MEIDSFTFWAQLVNFAILLALLKRFLYQPVLDVLAKRDAHYQERTSQLDSQLETVQQQEQLLERELRSLEAQSQQFQDEASARAEQFRRQLEAEARQQLSEQEEQWRKTVRGQLESEMERLRQEVGRQAVAVARRALTDLAGRSLEEEIVAQLLETHPELAAQEATVRTRWPLEPPLKTRLERLLGICCFEHDPQLVAGIEVEAGGILKAWSIDGYLESFERALLRDEAGS